MDELLYTSKNNINIMKFYTSYIFLLSLKALQYWQLMAIASVSYRVMYIMVTHSMLKV